MYYHIKPPGCTYDQITYRLAPGNNSVLGNPQILNNPLFLNNLVFLAIHPAITELTLCINQIGDAVVAQAFAKALENNTSLTSFKFSLHQPQHGIDPYTQISPEFAQAFAEKIEINNTLTSLTLICNTISIPGSRRLIFNTLKNNKTLTSLTLNGISLNYANTKSFAEALKQHKTLTSLDLEHCDINNAAMQILYTAIETNKTLTSFKVSWDLRDNRDETTEILVKVLMNKCPITELDFSVYLLGDQEKCNENARRICKALWKNSTVATLDFSVNELDDTCIPAIADLLEINETITWLSISGNKFSPDCIITIAKALKKNNTLTALDLGPCCFGDAGARAIAQTLSENCVLESLEIYFYTKHIPNSPDNTLTYEGIIALDEALNVNSSLIDVSFTIYGSFSPLRNNDLAPYIYSVKSDEHKFLFPARHRTRNMEIARLVKLNKIPKSLAVIILNPDYRGMLFLLMMVTTFKKIEPGDDTQPNLLGEPSHTLPSEIWAQIFNFLMPNGAPPFTSGTLKQSGNIMAQLNSRYRRGDEFARLLCEVLCTHTEETLEPYIQANPVWQLQRENKALKQKVEELEEKCAAYEGPGKRTPDGDSQPPAKRQRLNNQGFFATTNQQVSEEKEQQPLSLTP